MKGLVLLRCRWSPYGPSLPHRPRVFVSVIRCLAAALGRCLARQLMTHSGRG
jgi:hypothetical protein